MNDDGGRLPDAPHTSSPTATQPGADQVQQARALLRWSMLLLIGAMATSSLLLPWKVLGLAFGLAALGVGTVAFIKALRAGLPPVLKVAAAVGLVAALFISVGTGAAVILWPLTQRYEECMATALTLQAKAACEEQLRSLDGLLGMGAGN